MNQSPKNSGFPTVSIYAIKGKETWFVRYRSEFVLVFAATMHHERFRNRQYAHISEGSGVSLWAYFYAIMLSHTTNSIVFSNANVKWDHSFFVTQQASFIFTCCEAGWVAAVRLFGRMVARLLFYTRTSKYENETTYDKYASTQFDICGLCRAIHVLRERVSDCKNN